MTFLCRQFVTALCAAEVLTACTDESDLRCQQTYEFGNYGCADVVGRLLGRDDQPLGGAGYDIVNLDPGTGSRFQTSIVPVTPDAAGNFRLRVTRVLLNAPPTAPDTGSVWVRAGARPPIITTVPGIRDSVLVTLLFAPIGSVPEPTQVVIRLPVP